MAAPGEVVRRVLPEALDPREVAAGAAGAGVTDRAGSATSAPPAPDPVILRAKDPWSLRPMGPPRLRPMGPGSLLSLAGLPGPVGGHPDPARRRTKLVLRPEAHHGPRCLRPTNAAAGPSPA